MPQASTRAACPVRVSSNTVIHSAPSQAGARLRKDHLGRLSQDRPANPCAERPQQYAQRPVLLEIEDLSGRVGATPPPSAPVPTAWSALAMPAEAIAHRGAGDVEAADQQDHDR